MARFAIVLSGLLALLPFASLLVGNTAAVADDLPASFKSIELRPRLAPLVEVQARSLWGDTGRVARSSREQPRLSVLAVFDRAESVADLAAVGVDAAAVVGRVASLSVSPEDLQKLSNLKSVVEVDVSPPTEPHLDVNAAEERLCPSWRASGETWTGCVDRRDRLRHRHST